VISKVGFSSKFFIHTETTQIILNDGNLVQAINIHREIRSVGWIKIICNKNNMVGKRIQQPTQGMDVCVLSGTGLCDELIPRAEET
jgi:phosphate starvation-inducible protein PhoH